MDVSVRSEIMLAPLSSAETVEDAIRAIEKRGVTVLTYSVGTDYERGVETVWDVFNPGAWLQEIGVPTAGWQPITVKVRGQSDAACKRAVHEGIADVSGWSSSMRAWFGEIKDEVVVPTIQDTKKVIQDNAEGFGIGLGVTAAVIAVVALAYFAWPLLLARK